MTVAVTAVTPGARSPKFSSSVQSPLASLVTLPEAVDTPAVLGYVTLTSSAAGSPVPANCTMPPDCGTFAWAGVGLVTAKAGAALAAVPATRAGATISAAALPKMTRRRPIERTTGLSCVGIAQKGCETSLDLQV